MTLLGGMRVVIVEAVTTMVVDGIVFRMERKMRAVVGTGTKPPVWIVARICIATDAARKKHASGTIVLILAPYRRVIRTHCRLGPMLPLPKKEVVMSITGEPATNSILLQCILRYGNTIKTCQLHFGDRN